MHYDGNLKIWVVDDNPPYRALLETFFSMNNHDVLCFPLAKEALEDLLVCRSGLPQVIISDVEMPHMDGFEFLLEVRRHYPGLPFFLLTAAPCPINERLALQNGATHYSGKTISLTVLLHKIHAVFATPAP